MLPSIDNLTIYILYVPNDGDFITYISTYNIIYIYIHIYIYIASSTAANLYFKTWGRPATVVTPTRTQNDGIYIYDGPDTSSLRTAPSYRRFTGILLLSAINAVHCSPLPRFYHKRIQYNNIYIYICICTRLAAVEGVNVLPRCSRCASKKSASTYM